MMATRRTEQRVRNLIRRAAQCSNPTQPVMLVDDPSGKESIGFTGERWHYETRGGRRIWHPTAYSRRGWSNMVYCHSTHKLECGREFYEFLIRFLG